METEYAVIITEPLTGEKKICRYDLSGKPMKSAVAAVKMLSMLKEQNPDLKFEWAPIAPRPSMIDLLKPCLVGDPPRPDCGTCNEIDNAVCAKCIEKILLKKPYKRNENGNVPD
jgi:hypothetical protein